MVDFVSILWGLLFGANIYLFLVSFAVTRQRGADDTGVGSSGRVDGGPTAAENKNDGGDGDGSAARRRDAVLLVIAHPDDEAMFFVPTLRALVAHPEENHVYVLCLSNGGFDGLGEVRAKEMLRSAEVLGIAVDDVRIVDDPRLQDGMQNKWAAADVAGHVQDCVEAWGINRILTFDERGVSGHPNHIDTCHGVLHFLRTSGWGEVNNARMAVPEEEEEEHRESAGSDGIRRRQRKGADGAGKRCKLRGVGRVYQLQSTGFVRKYMGFLDVLFSTLQRDTDQCFCNFAPWVNYRAMQAHFSQFVWYRRAFVVLSRYTFVNNLIRVGRVSENKSAQ